MALCPSHQVSVVNLPSMPVIASSTVITIVPVPGIVPRSVIGVSVDRSGITIRGRRVGIGGWIRIRASNGSAEERSACESSGDVPPTPRVAWFGEGQYCCGS